VSNPQKRKGDAAERNVAAWLAAHGFSYAERAYGAGRPDDVGDIDGIPGVVVEVKNHKTITIPAWLHELDVEMFNANARHGAVIAKRRGSTDVGDWYALMPVEGWARLLVEAGYGDTDATSGEVF
jgi:Holliday junction resolvase